MHKPSQQVDTAKAVLRLAALRALPRGIPFYKAAVSCFELHCREGKSSLEVPFKLVRLHTPLQLASTTLGWWF